MKKIIFLFLITAFAICCDEAEKIVNSPTITKSDKELAKEDIKENTYLDVDFELLNSLLITTKSATMGNDSEQMAKGIAALYRFYKKVGVEKGFYIIKVKDHTEINISPGAFSFLTKSIEDINKSIEEANKNGHHFNYVNLSLAAELYMRKQ